VPATLQATIAARIDRLDRSAKRTLRAAAVVGARFSLDLVTALGVEPSVYDLVVGQLIDQVGFTGHPEYVFHHPLIRAVAYESQLKSDRAQLHRRIAAFIEAASRIGRRKRCVGCRSSGGCRRRSSEWHMRAGNWATPRRRA
jgi:predicted ATPase